jgi:long-chain acyl-CoA synthetase
MQQPQNIYAMLENTVARQAEEAAYFEKVAGEWHKTTWHGLKEMSDLFGMALLAEGLEPRDAVSILSANRLLWPVSDLGTIAAGGIGVGIYPTNSPEQCAYILSHSKSRFVVVDTDIQLKKILAVKEELPCLRRIILGEKTLTSYASKVVMAWDDFLSLGRAYCAEGFSRYQQLAHQSRLADIAIVVYTSGTTGNPKGALLSHRYVITSCEALSHTVAEMNALTPPEELLRHTRDGTVAISFLPFCHVGERISGMYSRLNLGVAAYLVDDIGKFYQYLLEVNPHSFGGLPRFYEKIYAKIMNEVETGSGYDKSEFLRAIDIVKQVKTLRAQSRPLPPELAEEFAWAEEKVCRKVRANLGTRILSCTSGAAPVPKEVLEMFEYAGNLTILEAYGLTEFVCCAFNTPQAHKAHSVGRAMHGCEIRLAEDGEILLHGQQMFSGYLNDEAATREMIAPDGWLHTGDIGRLDDEGFLFITGRKKEFIKTSTGKKIAPLYIENLCKRNHLISNVMVYGDNKSYLVALITLNPVELLNYARVKNIAYRDYIELTQHEEIRKIVAAAIEEANSKVSTTEQVKKYTILDRDFAIEENEITPTGKVKRNVVTAKFRDVIEKMYAQPREFLCQD